MNTKFSIKRNDTLPVIVEYLSSDVGPINLASAIQVKFHLKKGSTVKVNGVASVLDAVNGKVEYAWVPTDTDTAGEYKREWEITFPSGVMTVPNAEDGYCVTVTGDLA